jgi:hypothetical protein
MKSILLTLCLVSVLAFFSAFVFGPSAMACVPLDDGMTRCDRPRLVRPPVVVAAVVKPPTAVPTANPKRGTSPYDAIEPNDTWQTIGANANVWFRIGEEGLNHVHLDVWVDAYGKSGISFAVFSPEQFGDLSPATPPKGRGTANKSDKTHDLMWSGQAPAGGTWYVLVSNSNSTALSYKVGYNRVVTGPKDCSGPYWEWIGGHVNSEAIWPGYCP